jgi:ElaB/YqjD/DUF883 family membrane-anchored ribosome-binding protein
MAKKPDEVEREIEEHRRTISRKIEALQGRVEEDLNGVKSEVEERTSGLRQQAGQVFDLESQVREHPLTTVAGAFGVGIAMGLVSELGGDRVANGSRGRRDYSDRRGDNGGGALAGALGSVVGMLSGVVQDELRQMFEEGLQRFTQKRDEARAGSRGQGDY